MRFGPAVWAVGLSYRDVPPQLRDEMRTTLFDAIKPLIRGDPEQNHTYPDDDAINGVVTDLLEDLDYELIPGLWETRPRWDYEGVLSDPRPYVALSDTQEVSLVFYLTRWNPRDSETRYVSDLHEWGLTREDLLDCIRQQGYTLGTSGWFEPSERIKKALEGREEQIESLFY